VVCVLTNHQLFYRAFFCASLPAVRTPQTTHISHRLRLCPHKPPIISPRLRSCPHPLIILYTVACACLLAGRSPQTTNHLQCFLSCLYQPPKYSTNDICKKADEVDEDNSNIVGSSKIAVGEDTHRGVRFFRLIIAA
jgi:hypothetical protein